ncbi:cytochrome P450 [Russula vinacea]|nr:cytochrome P450 [Russula vinacea]
MLDESTVGLTGFLVLVSLYALPTIGFNDPILSYLSAFRYNFGNGALILKQGYEKTKPVVPSGLELIEEVMKAPDTAMAVLEPLLDHNHLRFFKRDTPSSVVRSKLTRNIAATFDQVHEELVGALKDCIPTTGQEWVKVSIMPTVQRIVCRASSRVLVATYATPIKGRDHDYQTLVINCIANLIKSGFLISCFPKFLKPIVARLICRAPTHVRQTMEFIRPIVEERSAKMKEFGENWDDAPSDMLMWLMSEAKGVERSLEAWARRLLMLNFAFFNCQSHIDTDIHQTLYRLLAHPEYIELLRQEVEAVVAEEGWTKAGMDKMHKIDSFGMNRLALGPFTFSNGVTIPAGTFFGLPVDSVHMDEEIYPNAQNLMAFAFRSCPGRFLAANEVKALLAHILVTYDIKFEEGNGVPRERRFASFRAPRNANILFRKRRR